jgi:hypothetical protein
MSGMSTAEYEQLSEIREELEGIHNIVMAFYVCALFAAALYLFKASGVSVQWLTN